MQKGTWTWLPISDVSVLTIGLLQDCWDLSQKQATKAANARVAVPANDQQVKVSMITQFAIAASVLTCLPASYMCLCKPCM